MPWRGRRASFAICARTAKLCFCLESCGVQASILQSSGVARSSSSKEDSASFRNQKHSHNPPDRDCLEKPEENKQQLKDKHTYFCISDSNFVSVSVGTSMDCMDSENTEKSFQEKKIQSGLCNFWESKCIDFYQSAMNQSCVYKFPGCNEKEHLWAIISVWICQSLQGSWHPIFE